MYFCLDGVDDFLPVPQLEWVEVTAEPVSDGGVSGALEDAVSKARNTQQVWYLQHRMLRAAACDWIDAADRFVRLKQGHEREAKGVLHARTPEGVELTLEDAQRVTDRLIAVPAETHVEQIYTEGTLRLAMSR